jgi:hypothetical protein
LAEQFGGGRRQKKMTDTVFFISNQQVQPSPTASSDKCFLLYRPLQAVHVFWAQRAKSQTNSLNVRKRREPIVILKLPLPCAGDSLTTIVIAGQNGDKVLIKKKKRERDEAGQVILSKRRLVFFWPRVLSPIANGGYCTRRSLS